MPQHDPVRDIDTVLRRVVLVFRVLALLWMGGLVSATLFTDDGVEAVWVVAAMAVAAATTAGTWYTARSRRLLASWWWITIDGAAAFFIGISPGLSGAADLFYGGMPLSWLLLVVYAHSSFVLGGVAVGLLAVTQGVNAVLDPAPLSATESVGRVAVWVVSALAYGWAMWALRRSEAQRITAEEQRDAERIERRLADERAELAARLHDSVLQTLALVQTSAADAESVRSMARQQELELRNLIDEMASPFEHSLRAELRRRAAVVEERHGVRVITAFVGDADLSPSLSAVVDAAREAMVNAAKHSGAEEIALMCEVTVDAVTVYVRDRGSGFDPASVATGGGLEGSIVDRMKRHGGDASIRSSLGSGTEVQLSIPVLSSDE